MNPAPTMLRGMAVGVLIAVLTVASTGKAGPSEDYPVGSFSAANVGGDLPEGWKPLTFDRVERHTTYELVREKGVVVLEARSENAASWLIRAIDVDPADYPVLCWRWKVQNLVAKSDVHKKQGDDFPARVNVTFRCEPERLGPLERVEYALARAVFGEAPLAAISYVWATRTPLGTMLDSPYSEQVKLVVAESGPSRLGRWMTQSGDVRADFRRAFGEEPPNLSAVAIMTDTDDTGESATAYYGDIELRKAR